MNYIFSYGTLKDKYPENLSRTHIEGDLKGYFEVYTDNMYPELIKSDNLNLIEGVVIGVNNEEFSLIDKYEGYPDIYNRGQYNIKTELGNLICWVYYIDE